MFWRLRRLKHHLRKQLQKQHKPVKGQLGRLKKRLRELDKQIDTGAERVLTAPEELLDVLTGKLQQLKRERDQISAELRAAKPATPVNVQAHVDRIAGKAWTLLDDLENV